MMEHEAVKRISRPEHKSVHTFTYCIVGNVHWSKVREKPVSPPEEIYVVLIFEFCVKY